MLLPLVLLLWASAAHAEGVTCEMGDKVMGPNCVHEKVIQPKNAKSSVVLSTVYRIADGKKVYLWGEELGVVISSDSAHISVRVDVALTDGTATHETTVYPWIGSRYSEP